MKIADSALCKCAVVPTILLTTCALTTWDAMRFGTELLTLAGEFKGLGLPWEPAVGNYVYDSHTVVQPTSPFQDHGYFLLNYECFMRKVGSIVSKRS